eukprot:1018151-Prorocentrum_minimum.AAC.1
MKDREGSLGCRVHPCLRLSASLPLLAQEDPCNEVILSFFVPQMKDMMTMGHDVPDGVAERNRQRIGKFGVGFKSGAMAIGKDAIVFTHHEPTGQRTVGFLSQSYNIGEKRQASPNSNSILPPE